MIEIDKRSDDSAYVKVGDITVYVEDSEAAPEYVHIWRNRDVSLFLSSDGKVEINGENK